MRFVKSTACTSRGSSAGERPCLPLIPPVPRASRAYSAYEAHTSKAGSASSDHAMGGRRTLHVLLRILLAWENIGPMDGSAPRFAKRVVSWGAAHDTGNAPVSSANFSFFFSCHETRAR